MNIFGVRFDFSELDASYKNVYLDVSRVFGDFYWLLARNCMILVQSAKKIRRTSFVYIRARAAGLVDCRPRDITRQYTRQLRASIKKWFYWRVIFHFLLPFLPVFIPSANVRFHVLCANFIPRFFRCKVVTADVF